MLLASDWFKYQQVKTVAVFFSHSSTTNVNPIQINNITIEW